MVSGKIPDQLQRDREDLFRLVWSMPSEQAAASLGISGVALGKRCAKLGVPKPARGYWAKYKDKSDRPVPPLAAYQDSVAAKLSQRVLQQGVHLSPRRLKLFRRAIDGVQAENPDLGSYELKGSRLIFIDPALASATLTSAVNNFPGFLAGTPFASARRVASGLIDVLLPLMANHVLVFPKSERSAYRNETEFIIVRISETLLRHIANAHRLIEELQLAFTAIPLTSSEYCHSVRYVLSPESQLIPRADLCVSRSDAWLRIEQESPSRVYETLPVPIGQFASLPFIPEKSHHTHTDPEPRIYREDWGLLVTLLEAEDIYQMAESVVSDLQDDKLQAKLARAMKLWWPAEHFQALQVLQEGLNTAEERIERWESELEIARQGLCQKLLGIRLGDILQVIRQGSPDRIQVDRLDVSKYEHNITFMAHGQRIRKDGVIGKRRDTLYLALPQHIAHELTGHTEPRESTRQPPKANPSWKWTWRY